MPASSGALGRRDYDKRRSVAGPFRPLPEGQGTLLKLTEGASLRGTVFNLVNSMMGAGILALPYTCSQCGWALTLCLLLVLGGLSDLTIWMLVYCLDATRERSYAGMAEVLHCRGLGQLIDVLIFSNNLGTMTSYVIIIGDLLPSLLAVNFGVLADWSEEERKVAVLSCMTLPLLGVSALKSLDALRHVSLVCIIMILVFVVSLVTMGGGLFHTVLPEDAAPQLITTDYASVLRQIPVMVFAFRCQQNVPIFYAELRRQKCTEFGSKFPTKRSKMMAASHWSTVVAGSLYAVAAFFGYMAFRQRTEKDVLVNFDVQIFWPAELVRGCYVLVIMCSYPVMAFSAVVSFHRLLSQCKDCCTQDENPYAGLLGSPMASSPAGGRASAWPLLPRRSEIYSEENQLPGEQHLQEPRMYEPAPMRPAVSAPSDWVRLAEVFVIVAFSVTAGILVPNITLVFGLTGGLCASSLMYIFPPTFYLKVKKDRLDSCNATSSAWNGPPLLIARAVQMFGIAIAVGSTSSILINTLHSLH